MKSTNIKTFANFTVGHIFSNTVQYFTGIVDKKKKILAFSPCSVKLIWLFGAQKKICQYDSLNHHSLSQKDDVKVKTNGDGAINQAKMKMLASFTEP